MKMNEFKNYIIYLYDEYLKDNKKRNITIKERLKIYNMDQQQLLKLEQQLYNFI